MALGNGREVSFDELFGLINPYDLVGYLFRPRLLPAPQSFVLYGSGLTGLRLTSLADGREPVVNWAVCKPLGWSMVDDTGQGNLAAVLDPLIRNAEKKVRGL